MENRLRVLIVDDSMLYRSQIRAALDGVDGIEVVGFASNGRLACEVLKTKQVDVVTLDLEMPEMDGLATLAELKRLGVNVKTVVLSAHSEAGASSTLEALRLGASDFMTKPQMTATGGIPSDLLRAQLLPKLRQFQLKEQAPSMPKLLSDERRTWRPINLSYFKPQVVVIASSTGGPNALEHIFSRLKAPLGCPVLIAQHMPALFTAILAERLTKVSGLRVREAIDGEPLSHDTVYLAPGDYHMRVAVRNGEKVLELSQDEKRNSVRPAADFLFESAAEVYGAGCLGIVLTGMGSDGRDGSVRIKESSGAVLIQSQRSCVVFGMPGAVHVAQAYDAEGDLDEITARLIDLGVFRKRDQSKSA